MLISFVRLLAKLVTCGNEAKEGFGAWKADSVERPVTTFISLKENVCFQTRLRVKWRKPSCFDCVISKHSVWIDNTITMWYLEMDHSFVSHQLLVYSGWTLIRPLSKGQLLFLMQCETEFKAGMYFLFNSLHNLIVSGWEVVSGQWT